MSVSGWTSELLLTLRKLKVTEVKRDHFGELEEI